MVTSTAVPVEDETMMTASVLHVVGTTGTTTVEDVTTTEIGIAEDQIEETAIKTDDVNGGLVQAGVMQIEQETKKSNHHASSGTVGGATTMIEIEDEKEMVALIGDTLEGTKARTVTTEEEDLVEVHLRQTGGEMALTVAAAGEMKDKVCLLCILNLSFSC